MIPRNLTERQIAILLSERTRTRFESLFIPEPNSGCWLWLASDHRGYGCFKLGSHRYGGFVTIYAHRVSWLLSGRALPAVARVLHKCDTPPCVNPDHLFLGSMADNNRDKALKGRGPRGSLPFGVDRLAKSPHRYRASVTKGGRRYTFGYFDSPEEASAAALAGKASLYGRTA